ncbi:MAG: M1 family aminopeptidase [Polyangiales bacterium]
MTTRRLALALGLAACSSTTPRPAPEARGVVTAPDASTPFTPPAALASGRLPPLARPTHYSLSLTLDPRREDYAGEVRIDVDVPAPTRAVVLHARGLTIATASVMSGERALTADHLTRRAVGGREADEELVLTTAEPIAAGRARIDLRFTGSFSPDLRGAFRVRAGDDWYAFSDFEPTDARRAFPCFDEPSFKVPVEVSITAPDAMTALANMPEESHTDDPANHTRTHRFAVTPPMPTYLVSFAAGPFEFFEGPREPVPVRVVTVRGRAALGRLGAETAAEHLRVLGDYFGRPYPYPKLDLVAVPDFLPGAMENPGLITFRDAALLVDADRAPSRSRYHVYSIIAHELAHQWFGNLVTMAWWDDLWLNEGFATWAGARVLDTWRPALGARYDEVGGSAWARNADSLASAHAMRVAVTSTSQAIESFDATTYSKGAALLGMLEAWVGPERFREGVRAYLRAHAWGNATAADLLDDLTTAAGRDVGPVARSFLDQTGVPLIDARVECAANAPARLTLRQSRFSLAPRANDTTRWSIPVCVRYPSGASTRSRCVVLSDETMSEALETRAGECPAWLAPNADARGYYWYRLTPEGMRALVASPTTLSAVEKLDLLSNAEALVDAGALDASAYIDVIARLANDRDANVADRAIGRIFNVEHAMVTDASRPAFRAWAQRVVGPRARALGFATRPGDDDVTKDLRRSALSVLGALTDDPWARREAEAAASRWLADRRSVDGDLAAIALPLASRHGDAARFDALRAALDRPENTPQERAMILGALVSFDDLSLVRRAYELSLTDAIRAQDLRALYGRSGASTAARALLLDWAREHFDALHARLGHQIRAIIGSLGARCDEASIAEGERFLRERLGELEGVTRSLQQTAEVARQCAAVRARESERAAAAFTRR